ncbi:MAG: hypothetical protein HWE13_05445 [Gammaproteobacteria bacterium]|nr:hypothetical protein [Gammaproteobacteria bacterium]NVK87546.1 hypothetical protein [Gammaproteobacteria bacterium]
MRLHKSILAALVATGLASTVSAGKPSVDNNMLQMPSKIGGNKVEITISGPSQFSYKTSSFSGNASVSASQIGFNQDGLYKFEILEIKELGEEVVQDDFNGRGTITRQRVESAKTSGTFRVVNGVMVDASLVELNEKALGIKK